MALVRGEVLRNDQFVTGCDIRIDQSGGVSMPTVVATDQPVPDGDYEIKRGESINPVTFKGGNCIPRHKA
jgi:hypothetical protein